MLTADQIKTLTPEQEKTLIDMGFKKKTVITMVKIERESK